MEAAGGRRGGGVEVEVVTGRREGEEVDGEEAEAWASLLAPPTSSELTK